MANIVISGKAENLKSISIIRSAADAPRSIQLMKECGYIVTTAPAVEG